MSEENTPMVSEIDYDLEDINVFGKPLNLKQSIANTGCLEFVLVRKFSEFLYLDSFFYVPGRQYYCV